MTEKFEVGDKVRLISDFIGEIGAGAVGVVTESSGTTHETFTLVRFASVSSPTNGSANGWYVYTKNLELVVEEKRKFSIGDRVRDIRYDVGATGVIVGNGSFFTCDWRVKYDSDGGHGLYRPEHLELIAVPVVAPSPKFNVGDRVKVVNAGSVRRGQSGKVVQITIRRSGVRYDVLFDDGAAMLFDESEITLHTPRTWSKPDASNSVGLDVIDTLVDEMTKALRAHGGDCETRRFGDAMIVVENGQAKIYRLEASSVEA